MKWANYMIAESQIGPVVISTNQTEPFKPLNARDVFGIRKLPLTLILSCGRKSSILKTWTTDKAPWWRHLWPRDHNLNNLRKGQLGDTTYQISKL